MPEAVIRKMTQSLCCALGLLLSMPLLAANRTWLESPAQGSYESGVGLIRGWVCDASKVEVLIDDTYRYQATYGSPRADTATACDDTNNGFGMVINWSNLGAGSHRLRAFADDLEFANVEFSVATLGVPFLSGVSGEFPLSNFPAQGDLFNLRWSQAQQNFVIAREQEIPGSANPPEVAGLRLESPAQGSFESGVALLRGWACEASQVEASIDNGPRFPIAYGNPRPDTRAVCGDTDNGFGMVINWNRFGDGIHRLRAFADGVEFADVNFAVATLGVDFLRGVAGEFALPDFPVSGRITEVRWSQAQQNFVIVGNRASGDAAQAHAGIDRYEGPGTCVRCHPDEAREIHGSVHYQQSGPSDFVSNIEGPAGERGPGAVGINTYCGAHISSPRFTCAGCHVGNGRFPKTPQQLAGLSGLEQFRELSNVDCLTCHQEVYRRYPDWTASSLGFEPLSIVSANAQGLPAPNLPPILRTGSAGTPRLDPVTLDFQFLPAGADTLPADAPLAPMPIPTVEAARTVHATTRQSCLNCHAGAGGSDGGKRGDLSSLLVDPPARLDVHMSSENGGADLTCADCHNAGGHRVRGRGLDLRPNDTAERFTCATSGCHDERPHGDFNNRLGSSLDTHALRIACQSCHIPTYAKGLATEVARDWLRPRYSDSACSGRGGWLPEETKQADLVPSYVWFDGTSEVYFLGEPLQDVPRVPLSDGSLAYVLGQPNGDVASPGAKIYPMKEHTSNLARHRASHTLIAHSTFEFFRSGDFASAVASGMAQTPGMQASDGYEIVSVHTFQTLNHGVESSENALDCGACHALLSGGPLRMNLKEELGYALKGPETTVCRQCHGWEGTLRFNAVHYEHVRKKGFDCAFCHSFSRPERALSTRAAREEDD